VRGATSAPKNRLARIQEEGYNNVVTFLIRHCVENAMIDEIKTVDDLLNAKNVTPEERELLKDIIEVARTNERKIREYAEQMKANFNRLSQALQTMEERTFILNKALQGLLDATDTLHLRLMPSEKFYRE
jgi:predicted transcriptional regulator